MQGYDAAATVDLQLSCTGVSSVVVVVHARVVAAVGPLCTCRVVPAPCHPWLLTHSLSVVQSWQEFWNCQHIPTFVRMAVRMPYSKESFTQELQVMSRLSMVRGRNHAFVLRASERAREGGRERESMHVLHMTCQQCIRVFCNSLLLGFTPVLTPVL